MNNKTYYQTQLVAVRRTTWYLNNSETPCGVVEYWKKLNPETDSCDAFEFEFARTPKPEWSWEDGMKQKAYIYSTIHGMEYMLSNKGYIGWRAYDGHEDAYMNYRADPDGYVLVDKFASPHELDLHLIVTVWPCADDLVSKQKKGGDNETYNTDNR